jgi:enoyl-CoA hydratase/carnithine racemase
MSTRNAIALEMRESVAILRFDRPDQMNAMTGGMVEEIVAALDAIGKNLDCHALVLCGSGGNFMAGADIKDYARQTAQAFQDFQDSAARIYPTLEGMAIPVIAAVEGYALGGGFEIALACDLIVAHPAANLGLPEVKLGLVPGGGGTQRLARKIGPNRAADILLTGRFIAATELQQWGVVNRVAENVLDEAITLAQQIAKYPAGAVANIKRLNKIAWMEGGSLASGLVAERDAVCSLFLTGDGMERIRAFVERSERRKAKAS